MKGERSGLRKSASREIAYLALSVALITVCAWITLPIGLVPFTLQTFAVCLVGALMGWKRGVCAVAVYLAMGLCGIPVFAGFKAGVPALFGPTGGYIFGFLFAALVPALFKIIPVRRRAARCALFYAGMLIGLFVCYLFGTAWFVQLYACTWGYALTACVLPYLLPDAVKLFVAAALAARLENRIR